MELIGSLMSYKVYKITNTVNGKVYIGRTKLKLARRLQQHFSKARNGSPYRLHKAICKYGEIHFTITLLDEHKDIMSAVMSEQAHIATIQSFNYDNGYNMSRGGLGELRGDESYLQQSRKMKGLKKSKEHLNKISNGLKKSYASGKTVPFYKGKKMPKEKTLKMTGNKKAGFYNKILKGIRVYEQSSNLIFDSMNDAARYFNVAQSSIARSIAKDRHCKNYKFKLIN